MNANDHKSFAEKEKTLHAKREEMNGLVNVMRLHTRNLTAAERQECANIEMLMEYRMKNLLLDSQIAEADLKIQAMKDSISTVKNGYTYVADDRAEKGA